MDRIFVALDVETTGLEPGHDEIIEIGAVKFRGDEVLEQFQSFVRPRHSLPIKTTRLTRISPEDLRSAPPFHEIAPQLVRFLKSYPVVGHSIGFDMRFLAAQGLRLGQPAYDTFELAALLMPGLSNYGLATLAARLDIPHPDAHRALADADVARMVFVRLLERLDALPPADIEELVRLTQRSDWPLRTLFMDAARERMFKQFTTPISATPDGNGSQHTPPKAEPLRPTGDVRPISLQAVERFFAPDGPLGRSFPGYEPRPQQIEMALAVASAFNASETLLVEAPTGTGKSLSYLVPAAHYARQRGERVVISTNTINLQDQLYFKDIPALQKVLAGERADAEPPFSAALLKGRGNYLCLRRYKQLRLRPDLTPEQVRALVKVQLWLPTTTSGDRAELMLNGDELPVWGDLAVTQETCTGPRCAEFNTCYFFKARREAEAAHLLVVNHALLLSDISAGGGVLPPYDHVIIDEAHNLEDVATDQLGFELDQAAILRLCDDLSSAGGPHLAGGLLAELPHFFRGSAAPEEALQTARRIADELRPTVERCRMGIYDLFNRLTLFIEREAESPYDPRLRITDGIRKQPLWGEVERSWEALALNLKTLGEGVERLQRHLESLQDAELLDYDALLLRVTTLLQLCQEFQRKIDLIVFGNPEFVCWLTLDQRAGVLRLNAAPLHVGEALQEGLFSRKQTVVLASATLTVDRSFAYVQERLGIVEPEQLALDSPFDYQSSTLIYLPVDMPEPNARGYQRAVEDTLIRLCAATGGRTLALFTANTPLKQAYRAIQEPLEDEEIIVLAQGIDGSRRSLLERFKEHPRTVLLGTNSFWEGIDVVGDALSVLVITKLPFSVPDDPVFAARSQQFQEPFVEYAVPQAILRFKQGFGRLIRSKDDRGVVVILDRRLTSKRYGRLFLNSLPPCTIREGRLRDLPAVARSWIDQAPAHGS